VLVRRVGIRKRVARRSRVFRNMSGLGITFLTKNILRLGVVFCLGGRWDEPNFKCPLQYYNGALELLARSLRGTLAQKLLLLSDMSVGLAATIRINHRADDWESSTLHSPFWLIVCDLVSPRSDVLRVFVIVLHAFPLSSL
jgi:hypothetical protein